MKEIKDRELLLHYLHAFQLDSIFHEEGMSHLSLCSFHQGEVICSQGDPAQHLHLLVKGKVKVYTTSSEGKALILSFKTPLEVIGDIEYVRGMDIVNTVEAVSPVHMIVVHQRWLSKYGKDNAPLLRLLLEIITRKFCIKSNSLSFNLMYPVEVRIASYLLSVSFDESHTLLTEQLSPISLKDAANLIGTSYRHLNRIIHKFCEEGLIERHRGSILVKDREGLSALANHNIYE
ncbi:Crp/Fnr family transcriptional regulator [Paenibacillus taiwanensis]|uniref:Crp/Fnr family transcriptional regulator n=1 Tax=Paenibacillus taiwanensis TaxID=401638 RepID=UPI000408598E|nr:Crp/Fnr family transcriptional regulator [Paenibacillus taiwanensis]